MSKNGVHGICFYVQSRVDLYFQDETFLFAKVTAFLPSNRHFKTYKKVSPNIRLQELKVYTSDWEKKD